MIAALSRLPMILLLAMLAGLAMLVPALQAAVLGQRALAATFAESAAALLLVTGLVALAVTGTPARGARLGRGGGGLGTLACVFTLLPAALAMPLAMALPDTGILNAWWEMLSCLTTTGATLYDPAQLAAPLHLWRGLTGWMGGLLTLAAAVAILAPLQVGGFELVATPLSPAESRRRQRGSESARMLRAILSLLPLYGGATLALWAGLVISGSSALPGLMRAMGTISTSGIAATAGPVGGPLAEAMIAAGLVLALSRRFWPGGEVLRTTRHLRDDPELRLALGVVAAVAVAVLVRHAVGAAEGPSAPQPALRTLTNMLAILWSAVFTALSYLTTTGWTSAGWQGAIAWSGLDEPGLILAGLAIIGGGAATAAGGVKLLRIAALVRHSGREMERIIHPSSVAGGGATWRRLRTAGAFLAFVNFMLFAVAILVIVLLLTLNRVEVETASVLAIAALSNTGPLMQAVAVSPALGGGAGIAGAPWEGWAGLPAMTKAVLAGGMVVGRLEILAILALASPGTWRR